MKVILFLLCSFLLFHTPAEPISVSAASKTSAKQNVSSDTQKKTSSKKYTFTPIPKSISGVSCQGFTLHFSNICTRTDLRTYAVAVKQNQQTYPCKLLSVSDNGTSAKYVPCQTLSTGVYSLQGFSKIGFTVVSSSLDGTTSQTPNTPSGTLPTYTPLPDVPVEPTQPPLSGYSYTLTAQTKKHEKISHALVEIYLDNQCVVSGETDDTGVYHIESTVFQPNVDYTVRIYKLVSAAHPAVSDETEDINNLSFEPQELSICFSNTNSIEQNVILYEPSETSILPVTICWSLDAWNALASQHPSVKASLWNAEDTVCLFEQTYTPSITAMTASIPLFEKEQQRLPSGSYVLRITISDDSKTDMANTESAHTAEEHLPGTFIYRLKLLHGEWITPVIINLP